ncbi:hypothetical protein SAMN04488127_0856 [Bhargavaea ginsengi]|uniref:Uncharacterized protein n=1 Tax=Bhargavaea ginsengi TaxID=426757 RepID=A0A1H6UV41_9BACL|nr:hypothetical protein [Bhargavaea ginsengi]SEI94504.1 hypothetical protein SAMN04488127_0856 [Bhargavaea ginsengi]
MEQKERTPEVMMFSYELLRLYSDRIRCSDKEVQSKITDDIKFLKQALKESVA